MAKKKSTSLIPNFIIGEAVAGHEWGGLNTGSQDTRFLARGESFDELNWITSKNKDNIQLRRGKAVLGKTNRNGNQVTGLGIGIRNDGLEIPFFTYDRKIMYYDVTIDDTKEVDIVDIFPLVASGDKTNIMSYTNLAGSFIYITSPHSSIYKIPVADPGSVVDQHSTDYRFGFAKINRSRMFGMDRQGLAINSNDNTGLYLSHIDKQLISQYTLNFIALPHVTGAVNSASGPFTTGRIYWVAVTEIGPSGIETVVSNSVGVLMAGGNTGIDVSWNNVAGASSYNVYVTDSAVLLLIPHTGTFTVGETVTGGTSGAKGVVVNASGGNLVLNVLTVANFLPGETATGGTSGAFGTVNSETGEFSSPFVSNTKTNTVPIFPAVGVLNTYHIPGINAGLPPTSSGAQQIIVAIGVGNGVTTTFTGTISTPIPDTNFFLSITDGIELFLDDKNGNLIGSLGGTGTINYATGAFSVTFHTAPPSGYPITASYYLEDATSGGVVDFAINTTDTTNSSGQVFRQDDGGGKAKAVWPYQGVEYCFHLLRSWLFSLTVTGSTTVFDNEPYYEQIGTPSRLGVFPTGDGIIFVNTANPTNPMLSMLTIPQASTNLTVVPIDLSNDKLKLSPFNFDMAVVFRADVYDFLCCAKYNNGVLDAFNSRVFLREKDTGVWNQLDYTITCLAQYLGGILAGDALSPNLYQLFYGFDDDGEVITNYWNSAPTDLDLDGLKKVGYFNIQGLIQNSQKVRVSYSLDGGAYVVASSPEFNGIIDGNGSYVNKSGPIGIGTFAIGTNVIGGGSSVLANFFEIDIPVHTDLFQYISFRLEAIDVGYVEIDKFQYKDIRFKRRRIIQYNSPEINE